MCDVMKDVVSINMVPYTFQRTRKCPIAEYEQLLILLGPRRCTSGGV